METPIGWIRLVATDAALEAVEPASVKAEPKRTAHLILQKAQTQIGEFFAGERTAFDVPLTPAPTPFQTKVRRALLQIPFGGTASYGQIAKAVGTKSPRAVGQAVGANPLLIIVPCHRVVASAGLGGFAWGLPTKKKLLAAERR